MPTTTPVTVKQTSPKWVMSAEDWLWTILSAVVLPVLPIINATLAAGSLTFPWHSIEVAAAVGFFAMLTKKLTNAGQTIITGTTAGTAINITAPPVGAPTTTTVTK
jgi:ABC-type cobalamin transport system ATPase subunit